MEPGRRAETVMKRSLPIIAPFWINGVVLWGFVRQASCFDCFHAFEDGYFCPVKFEML